MGVMGAGGGSAFLTPPHHDHQFIIAFAAEVPRSDAGRWAQSVSQSVISRSRPALAPPPARSPAPPLPV